MGRTADLFGVKPRRARRILLKVIDASSQEGDEETAFVHLECRRCGHDAGWVRIEFSELRAGVACPKCNVKE